MPKADHTVLIVEDDIVLRERLSGIAKSEGFDVATAGSLDFAWEQFVRWRPSRVLLNPGICGAVGVGQEFLHRLQTNRLSPRVALLTGSEWREVRRELGSLSPETILLKPVAKDDLLGWLRAAA